MSESTVGLLEKLIAFDTTSARSNLALIDFVVAWLRRFGIEATLVRDDSGTKANLYATIGPREVPGIMLSGHTDVVPVEGQTWRSDPFVLRESNGCLYGRGAADMKGFLACTLAMIPQAAARPLKHPIHLALSYDEEVGCVGVRRLIEMLERAPDRPAFGIIGEPTEMRIVTGHKGKAAMRCTVTGKAGHSAHIDRAVNALEVGAKLVARLCAIGDRLRAGEVDPDFDPPYTTVHVGRFASGTALNVVPATAVFDFEIRNLPRDDASAITSEIERFAAELLPRMRAVDPEAHIQWETTGGYPGLDTDPDSEVVAVATALTGRNALSKISFGTEGGLYQKAGVPTIVCGPGSIAQAHQPDEYIARDQLMLCDAFMGRLVRYAAGEHIRPVAEHSKQNK